MMDLTRSVPLSVDADGEAGAFDAGRFRSHTDSLGGRERNPTMGRLCKGAALGILVSGANEPSLILRPTSPPRSPSPSTERERERKGGRERLLSKEELSPSRGLFHLYEPYEAFEAIAYAVCVREMWLHTSRSRHSKPLPQGEKAGAGTSLAVRLA